MTEEKFSAMWGKLEKRLPKKRRQEVRERLVKVDDSAYNSLSALPYRNGGAAVVLAILFGYIGADRFYVRSIFAGIVKLLLAVAIVVCCAVTLLMPDQFLLNVDLPEWLSWAEPAIESMFGSSTRLSVFAICGYIIELVLGLWWIIDWFVICSVARKHNYKLVKAALDKAEKTVVCAPIAAIAPAAETDEKQLIRNMVYTYSKESLGIEVPLKLHKIGGEEIGAYVFFYLYVKQIDAHVSCSLGSFYSGSAFATINLGVATDVRRADLLIKLFNSKMPYKAYFSNYNVVIDFKAPYHDVTELKSAFNTVIKNMNECFNSLDFIQLAKNM